MIDPDLAIPFIVQQSTEGLILLFWFTLTLELPRYAFGFMSLGLATMLAERSAAKGGYRALAVRPTVSVVVVGHNEADALERCIRSLHEQTMPPTEIIVVSDGSSDGMQALAKQLVQQGLIRHALASDLRGGKSAGFNLALGFCQGDIIVNVDCDCSYDRFAFENLVTVFKDPRVGAASGDMAPRNSATSLVAKFQEIEYLISVSVGRRVAAGLDQVSCISGAFGAYRRSALDALGGCDTGGGEDLDLTLRLRSAGWRVTFVPTAVCYTDVPTRLWTLLRQRLRWERDSIRLRLRKHRRSLLGSARAGGMAEVVNQWDFLIFELGATAVFPFYLLWLFTEYSGIAVPILIAVQLGLLLLDFFILSLAGLVVSRPIPLTTLAYMPGYSIFAGWVMRPIRLLAFLHEWLLFGSQYDNYVPAKIRTIRKW